jgi:hypothetical protein
LRTEGVLEELGEEEWSGGLSGELFFRRSRKKAWTFSRRADPFPKRRKAKRLRRRH